MTNEALTPKIVLVFAVVLAVVAWRSVQHVNTQWDELNDHQAAVALMQHPLWGSGIDGSQARLPMYVTAIVYAVAGAELPVARMVSIIFGAATVVLTFYAGRRWFGQMTGLLAAGLLTLSPYFIGFSRMALTESDAFCPFFVLWSVLAYETYLRRRNTRSMVIFSVVLGLALAAKFYTCLLLPPLFIVDLIQHHIDKPEQYSNRAIRLDYSVLIWVLSVFLLVLLAMAATQAHLVGLSILLWIGSVIFLLIIIVRHVLSIWLLGKEADARMRKNKPIVKIDLLWSPLAWLVIIPLAATVCLAAFPEHVIQPEVARAFLRRLIRRDHAETMIAFIDPARLYIGVILLKMGLPLGVMTAAALIWAWNRSVTRPILRILISVTSLYALLLTTLPLRQTYYLMSVYPLLVLMLAAFILDMASTFRNRRILLPAWITIVVASCLYLIRGDVRVYPDYGLYGYETVGNRWLGGESRGYRNLIQTTNDGTEDALRWCLENVPPGKRVVSYLWDDHVVEAFINKHPPSFELVQRHPEIDKKRGPDIGDSDYLIVSINNEVSYRDLPPIEILQDHFDSRPIYTVWRGRTEPYRLPVVHIYQRRTSRTQPTM